MKKNWEVKKLGEICDFINRGISPKYHEKGGVCVINQKCIRDHRVNYDLARRHDCDAKIVSSERFIQVGDVLVNSTGTGTLGRVAQVRETPPEKTTVDSHITIVRPAQDKFYQDFFGYALIVIEEAIKESGEGCGGQTELARSVLSNNFSVSFPTSIPEQQRIVAILDEAFAAIATAKENAERNLQNACELFESYLQSVFANPGDAWEEKKLREIAEIFGGYAFKSGDFQKNGRYQVLRMGNVRSGIIRADESPVFIEKIDEKILSRSLLKPGDIIITQTGTRKKRDYGYTVSIDKSNYLLNQRLAAIRTSKNLDHHFFLYYSWSDSFRDQFFANETGTVGQGNVGMSAVTDAIIPLPPLPEQHTIIAKLDALSAETKKLEALYRQKLADLEELKKAVLQKAFEGEL